jgi:glycosyltransferase involved in cell wall biosynthesis
MFLRLSSLVRWAEVVHLTSVYSASTIPTLLLCRLQGKPVVWSTRGALQRWDGSTRAKIKSVWEKLCNLMCDRERVVLHVTSDAERSESLERIKNAGAVVIPNGIDLPESLCHDRESNETLRLLYLGRLHPIKGIENLLRAVSKSNREVRLSICGRGEPDYEHELRTIVNDLGLESRVTFQGQVEGRAKDEQFRDADLCVVPSFKENFCVVVAESLAHEVPVIASQGTPWQRLDEMGCGLCVENDADSLTRAIDRAALMPLREMGRRGRDWMKREYAWPAIAQQMADQYLAMIRATEERAATPRAKRQAA